MDGYRPPEAWSDWGLGAGGPPNAMRMKINNKFINTSHRCASAGEEAIAPNAMQQHATQRQRRPRGAEPPKKNKI